MTTETGDRAHLSIGEVLANLRDEFPDVTISKIRFLESQGLIDPERTPSGYRKFYAEDLDRLRWILYQQREHFLPLRVIKERLDRFGPSGAPTTDSSNGDSPGPALPPTGRIIRRPQPARPSALDAPTLPLDDLDDLDDEPEPADEQLGEVHDDDSAPVAGELTRADLLRETGITAAQLDELEAYALIVPIVAEGEQSLYDRDAVAVALVAAGFYARGIQARHLKMYQHFAAREAGLFAQVLMPFVKQRNPTARARTQSELEELARLGRRLRTVMLRGSLRQSFVE
jgi:DNA-binding transcriptional MerR regulator